ncbi:hypothetical protein EJO70_13055 [Variovorax sp. 553]|nr:hypothetical protein EJO70_13055 [Variovorax sp. 553]RSZ43709.1 hypothetical protein EJO71_13045 [Variovorax sp. 679]
MRQRWPRSRPCFICRMPVARRRRSLSPRSRNGRRPRSWRRISPKSAGCATPPCITPHGAARHRRRTCTRPRPACHGSR